MNSMAPALISQLQLSLSLSLAVSLDRELTGPARLIYYRERVLSH